MEVCVTIVHSMKHILFQYFCPNWRYEMGSCHTCRLNMVLIVRWCMLCVILSHAVLLLLSVLRSVEIWSGRWKFCSESWSMAVSLNKILFSQHLIAMHPTLVTHDNVVQKIITHTFIAKSTHWPTSSLAVFISGISWYSTRQAHTFYKPNLQ